MPTLLSLLPAVLAAGIQVSPETVPAAGSQDVILTLDQSAMVHVSARSKPGTSCEMVDHVRGPFASSGRVGRTNCDLDLLLDAGTYKLRLHSPPKGKGNVSVTAAVFTEANGAGVLLDTAQQAELVVRPGQQASWWLRIPERRAVRVRVAGRTAGLVNLWRNGEWLEPDAFRQTTQSLRPGQPIHEWWLERTLEAGNYLVTAYGTEAQKWTGLEESDLVTAWNGFAASPVERGVVTTIPAGGLLAMQVKNSSLMAFLSVTGAASTATQLMTFPLSGTGLGSTDSADGSCRVEPKALVPECAARSSGQEAERVVMVRGAPGTPVELRWAPFARDTVYRDGEYNRVSTTMPLRGQMGDFLLAVHDVPADRDAAPLACALTKKAKSGDTVVDTDFLPLSPDQPFEREFNYDGSGQAIWFEVTEWSIYTLKTSGTLKNHCELFRMEAKGTERLTESEPNSTVCEISKLLTAGKYFLKLYGGKEGIETLRMAKATSFSRKVTRTRTGCLFPKVTLESNAMYEVTLNRGGSAAARGLFLRPLPLTLTEPLPVTLEPGASVKLPLSAGRGVMVRALGTGTFTCALDNGPSVDARDGVCSVPESAGTAALTLVNKGTDGVSLTLLRPAPPVSAAALAAYSPAIPPLPVMTPDTPMSFDFERGQAHSVVFDVKQAGLYHVTTEGLLKTHCQVRTPIVPKLAEATSGGRGRNCLVATYLRPGRYLLTVDTVGMSRGRGALVMRRRAPKEGASVTADGEVFFKVPAGELIQQRLTVKKSGSYQLASTAQGASLSCRLDDPQGWPVTTLPTPCNRNASMEAGQYLWTQLPLTVDSMRLTNLRQEKSSITLSGNKPHELALNTWYDARQGKDGKDEFDFDVQADATVTFTLTGGMQGRLYRAVDAKTLKPVEMILPQVLPPQEESSEGEGVESYGDSEGMSDGEVSGTEGEGGGEGGDGEGGEGSSEEPVYRPAPARRAAPPPVQPQPQKVNLSAGRYRLVTEHSKGDVAITYKLRLDVETLIPGTSHDLQVPGQFTLRLPQDAVLRLRSEGETDVRCRIFNSRGVLVAESSDNGDDWNCALAEPLPRGDFKLVLESQTQVPGRTRISVSMPRLEDAPALTDGATLKTGSNVLVATVPPPAGDAVQALSFTSSTPFSCAVVDAAGALLSRQASTKDCSLLLRALGDTYRVRLWTLDRSAAVQVKTSVRPVMARGGNTVPAGQTVRAAVARPGRYRTADGVSCLPDKVHGLLRPCGPEVSLEAGDMLFAAKDAKGEAALSLEEISATLGTAREETVTLSRQPFIQRQTSSGAALHLLSVRVPAGSPSPPACSLTAGAREQRDMACFAASGNTPDSLVRWWTAGEEPLRAHVVRQAVAWPASSSPLSLGPQVLTLGAAAARFGLPARSFRLDAILPANAWAVQVDTQGGAVDLCAPKDAMNRCLLQGTGGEVVLFSPSEARAEVTLLQVDALPAPLSLAGVVEERAANPGVLHLRVEPGVARVLAVDGPAQCVVRLDDGTRVGACPAALPAGQGAWVEVHHDVGALRVFTHAPGQAQLGRWGKFPGGAPQPLPAAQAAALQGAAVDRTLVLDKQAVVHVHGDSGVCALLSGTEVVQVDGLDRGCELHRVLAAGTHRLVVRPFGKLPLAGQVAWTRENVLSLEDGVGPEQWLAGGQARFFSFTTASAGQVGLGLQVPAETLDCTVYDGQQRVVGEGCHQFLGLDVGTYLLGVRAPATAEPTRFRPVVLGLKGSKMEVPPEYLQDLFQRIGKAP